MKRLVWTVALAFSLVLAAGVVVAQLADSPWPCAHQNLQRTGPSPYPRADRPELIWTYQAVDKVLGSPIVGLGNLIYLTTPMYIYALNPSGQLLWSYLTLTDAVGGPVQADDGSIYIVGTNGDIYSFAPDGSLNWRENAAANASFSPTIGPNGSIYIGTKEYLLAMNPDGTLKWHFNGELAQYSDFEAAPAIAPDGTIYCPCKRMLWQTAVIALSPDKEELCEPKVFPALKQITPAIGSDGSVYVAAGSYLYALEPDLTEKWRTIFPGVINSSPSVTKSGDILVVCSDQWVYSISKYGPTGRLWKYHLGGNITASAVSDANGYIYLASPEGQIHALTPDGDLVWTYNLGEKVYSQMALGEGGELLVGLVDGRGVCLGATDSGNTAPSLQRGTVWPPKGNLSTSFHYTVDYYDPDGEAPRKVVVWIDHLALDMTLEQGTADNGTYGFSGTLSEGIHTYYFTATDGRGAWVKYPSDLEYFQGPEVSAQAQVKPKIFLVLEKETYRPGDEHNLYAYAKNLGDEPIFVDVYIALQWYDGQTFLYLPDFSTIPHPYASKLLLLADEQTPMYKVLSMTVPSGLREANYAWVGALTSYDTLEVLSFTREYWRFTSH